MMMLNSAEFRNSETKPIPDAVRSELIPKPESSLSIPKPLPIPRPNSDTDYHNLFNLLALTILV